MRILFWPVILIGEVLKACWAIFSIGGETDE